MRVVDGERTSRSMVLGARRGDLPFCWLLEDRLRRGIWNSMFEAYVMFYTRTRHDDECQSLFLHRQDIYVSKPSSQCSLAR